MTERTLKALEIVWLAAELGDYDSNVIGMAAEIIAEEEFQMTKTPRGTKAIDGTWFVGDAHRTVQVKAWSESRIKKWGNRTSFILKTGNLSHDLLLLLIYSSKKEYLVLYNGPVEAVGKLNRSGTNREIQLGNGNKLILSAEAQGEIDLLIEKDEPNQKPQGQPKSHLHMSPTFEIPGFPMFKRVLRLTHVDGTFDGEPKVFYADYDQELGREKRGVVIVVRDGKKVLHCSALPGRAFAQAWLFASKGYLFRQRRNAKIALDEGGPIEIYLATCENPEGAAGKINDKLGPLW